MESVDHLRDSTVDGRYRLVGQLVGDFEHEVSGVEVVILGVTPRCSKGTPRRML